MPKAVATGRLSGYVFSGPIQRTVLSILSVSFFQELMDQVKYLKMEKDVKNGTIRTHGAGKRLKFQ